MIGPNVHMAPQKNNMFDVLNNVTSLDLQFLTNLN